MERAILGAVLIEKTAITRLYGLLKPEHFYEDCNQFLCQRMFEMWQNGVSIDLLTVCASINHDKWAKITSDSIYWYVCELTKTVTSTAHLETHCMFIRQFYANRKVLEIKAGVDGGGDGIEALANLKTQIEDVFKINTSDDWQSIDEVLINGLISHMDNVKGKDIIGARSGFPTLDKMTYGFQAGQLIVIGARPSVGKSSFACSLALATAKQNIPVGIITLEMPNEQLGARLVSLESDIAFWRIWRNKLDDDQTNKVYNDMSGMSQLPMYLSDQSGVSISGIRAKAEKLKSRHGLGMLIIDYLQLMGTDDVKAGTREREVAKMSLACKVMAMEMKIPVILLAQLNRGSETGGGDKKPRLHNLRESGAIEQDADIVMMLHRDKLNEQELKSQGNYGPYDASLIIEKHRNGATCELPIKFDDDKMKFYEDGIVLNPMPLPNRYEPEEDDDENVTF